MSVLCFLLFCALIIVHFLTIDLNSWTFVATCIGLGLTEIAFAIESILRKDK